MTVRGIQPRIMHYISIACIGHNGACKEPVAFNTVVTVQNGLTSSGECVCECVCVWGGGVN